MERKDIPTFLQSLYEAKTKSEKLSIIRAFENFGCPLSDRLSAMLHQGAPTYPRDYKFIGFNQSFTEVVDFAYRPGFHWSSWCTAYRMDVHVRDNPDLFIHTSQPVESKDVFDML